MESAEMAGAAGGGAARLLEINDTFMVAPALHVVAELGIADLLAGGPRTADDLAGAVSVNPQALYRVLRTLAASGVFTEVEPGRFGLNEAGEHLRTDHPQSLHSLMRLMMISGRAFLETLHSVRSGRTGFEQTYGEPVFQHLERNPDKGAVFNAAMADLSRMESAAVAAAYDLDGAGTIVDVGGGNATLLATILPAAPEASGVLFDQPHVIDQARATLETAGLIDRCRVVGGDFFEEVPAGGDVYLIKSVIHNWTEDEAVAILRNCREAMAPGGRVLILERVVPPGDTPHDSKVMDLIMLVVTGGRERTRDEYAGLLAGAGLTLTRVVDTFSPLSVIEAVAADG